jgi:hypothetical protein
MSQSSTRLVVGGIIAALFLGLFGYILIHAILYAQKLWPTPPSADGFYLMNIIGGLVSAVVVAELALTATGGVPTGRTFAPEADADSAGPQPRRLAIIYVFVWLALGMAALLFGLLNRQVDVQPLIDFAKTWVGLAIAAAYAYFGIQPANGQG